MASAQDYTIRPYVALSGSIGNSYTDNIFVQRTGGIADHSGAQSLQLDYTGRTASGFYYQFFAKQLAEFYRTRADADSSLWGAGFTFSQVLPDASVMGVTFDPKFNYRDLYIGAPFDAYDLVGFWSRAFRNIAPGLVVTPRFSVANRWSNLDLAERWAVEARLIVVKELTEKWSFSSTTRAIYLQHYTGLTRVPRDQLYIHSMNLNYTVVRSSNYELTFSPGITFSARRSNVAAREYEQWTGGPNFDFRLVF